MKTNVNSPRNRIFLTTRGDMSNNEDMRMEEKKRQTVYIFFVLNKYLQEKSTLYKKCSPCAKSIKMTTSLDCQPLCCQNIFHTIYVSIHLI